MMEEKRKRKKRATETDTMTSSKFVIHTRLCIIYTMHTHKQQQQEYNAETEALSDSIVVLEHQRLDHDEEANIEDGDGQRRHLPFGRDGIPQRHQREAAIPRLQRAQRSAELLA